MSIVTLIFIVNEIFSIIIMHKWKNKILETVNDGKSALNIEENGKTDSKHFRTDNNFAIKFLSKLNANGAHESLLEGRTKHLNRNVEDLPDGACFSRILQIHSLPFNSESTIKKCEYIGSFPVSGSDQIAKTEFVRAGLKQIRDSGRKRCVLLVLSLSGIKVCSLDGKSVLMAHALRRISFATCDPEHHQFSFLAREPNGHFNLQYCHSFLTQGSKIAEELSAVIGSFFRMAYAQQLQQATPTLQHVKRFHSEQQSCRRRSPSSPVVLGPFLGTCRENVTSPRPAARACWAKKLAGKTKHNDPLVNQALELPSPSSCLISSVEINTNVHKTSMAMNQTPSNRSPPDNLPIDIWSTLSGSTSSEDNSSPTDLNSCKQLKSKPPLLKDLKVVHENVGDSDSFSNEIVRPPSGGYINEENSWDGATTLQVSTISGECKFEVESFVSQKEQKFPLVTKSQSPTAPPTDEESFLESSTDHSSKRSSRSSCDHSMPSSSSSISDATNFSENSDTSSCFKMLRNRHSGSASSNTSITPPPPPERHDSLTTRISEERELRGAPWFQAGIPREIALEVLGQEPVGSFMVRESTSKPGCFALSLRVPRDFHQAGIAHYLIMRTNRGYKIKGFTKEFNTLTALITHHSVMPELLPCPLSLSRYNPTFKKNDSEDMVDINEDPDYNLLSDFRKMLTDVNV